MAKIEGNYNIGMANELSVNSLLSEFSIPEKNDWVNAAAKETGLSHPLTELSWQVTKELTFLPFYDHSDTDTIHDEAFSLRACREEFRSARFWLNLPPVADADAGAANAKALEHLAKEADGIFFFGTDNIERRLENIDLAACTVSLSAKNYPDVEPIAQLVRKSSGPQHINLLWESTPPSSRRLLDDLGSVQGVRALGLMVTPGEVVAEIADALFEGVTLIDQLTDTGLDPADVLTHIHFSLATSNDFFITLAKLRVIRILWYQVIRAYGVDKIDIDEIFVHARTNTLKDARFEPRGALISNTTTSIAAIFGGCNALTIFPEEDGVATSDRVARNVSTILADEAHMNKVADPFAGSYFIENLVCDLARNAWNVFRNSVQTK